MTETLSDITFRKSKQIKTRRPSCLFSQTPKLAGKPRSSFIICSFRPTSKVLKLPSYTMPVVKRSQPANYGGPFFYNRARQEASSKESDGLINSSRLAKTRLTNGKGHDLSLTGRGTELVYKTNTKKRKGTRPLKIKKRSGFLSTLVRIIQEGTHIGQGQLSITMDVSCNGNKQTTS